MDRTQKVLIGIGSLLAIGAVGVLGEEIYYRANNYVKTSEEMVEFSPGRLERMVVFDFKDTHGLRDHYDIELIGRNDERTTNYRLDLFFLKETDKQRKLALFPGTLPPGTYDIIITIQDNLGNNNRAEIRIVPNGIDL